MRFQRPNAVDPFHGLRDQPLSNDVGASELLLEQGAIGFQETLDGRAIFVRFVISCATKDSCRFEQAFSDDGGKTWEVNWIATDTRVKE